MSYPARRLPTNTTNPNEGPPTNNSPVEHPDDEVEMVPPTIHRRPQQLHTSLTPPPPPHQHQQQQQLQSSPTNTHHHHHHHASSLASKPHAFGGAVLSPDHARNLTTDLVLQLASALSVQASHAANSRGIVPPGENVNLFMGSNLIDVLTGGAAGVVAAAVASSTAPLAAADAAAAAAVVANTTTSVGGDTTTTTEGTAAGSVFRTVPTPATPNKSSNDHQQQHQLAPSILQLLRGHPPPPTPNNKQQPSTPGFSTPGTAASIAGTSSSGSGGMTSPMNTPTTGSLTLTTTTATTPMAASTTTTINPLSLLSTSEALESFGAWRTHYTVWITEAWNILKWSEPSAALFWEMATMFHTLYVASLSVRGGGSGGEVRGRVLGGGESGGGEVSEGGGGGVGGSTGNVSSVPLKSSSLSTATPGTNVLNTSTSSTGGGGGGGVVSGGNYIPPLLSCGSQSSMGSVRSGGHSIGGGDHPPGGGGGTKDPSSSSSTQQQPHVPQTPTGGHSSSSSRMKPARHSAKELPVWLISMFLLAHCETESFLRCTSGEDERRFSDVSSALSPLSASNIIDGDDGTAGSSSSLDFSALLHHKTLSPRTRLHAGMHQNNANCAKFLLRHLRKFILLCAVPRNIAACKAVAMLATRGGGGGDGRHSDVNRYAGGGVSIDTTEIEQEYLTEHGNIGLDIELTVEELDRLHLVLQAPSGGLVDDPPVAIGEHILRCLVEEEMEEMAVAAAVVGEQGTKPSLPNSHRWNLMQNGLITVGDAERVLRRYLEEELALAKQELDGDDAEEDVTSKLSKLSLAGMPSAPLSPSRSRGVSLASTDDCCDATGAAKDSSHSYLKELSYQKLRSTTVLLEPGKDTTLDKSSPTNNGGDASSIADSQNDQQSQTSRGSSSANQQANDISATNDNNNGRLHDLHVADCSDTHFYLLQPFEHATIAACTDCTIVLGAVAGLLHVVDCERTTITSAARRVVVSNSFDVVQYLFTPSPPLLVGDNRGCQFAPYNTYYEGLREDLLSTGLAAVLRSASTSNNNANSSSGSVAENTTASPGRDNIGGRSMSPTSSGLPTLQCASNKWKVPVELCKLEVPQLPNVPTPGSPGNIESPSGSLSPGADDRALGGSVDVSMKTPVLLPASEFDVLLVPVESEDVRIQRQLLRESQAEAAIAATTANNHEEEDNPASDAGGEEANETTTVYSTTSSLTGVTGDREKGEQPPPPLESDYCRTLADLLTLSPFHMPHDYERRVIAKADRVRTLQQAIVQELNDEQRSSLEEELNRGFQDWLVTSGNLRQVLDLIHLEKRVAA
ncbi:hypothetical protein ACHAXR_013086 [Thalassiosira sp. AJA248-18]